jgi:inward rectifier potassium channel
MSLLKKINSKAKAEINTGFGTNASNYGGRFINKSGNANVKKTGIGFFDSISWYHTMLNIPRWKFLVIVVLFYFLVNFIFAGMYYAIGVEHLKGVEMTSAMDKFGEAFFFSIQTFTTVGYGHISPSGFATSFTAAVEALFGLLSFAIATGLFYGRFSKPKAHILFSNNALIAPYGNGTALMLRMTPYKNTNLSDAEAKLTLGMGIEEKGKLVNKFFNLDLEIEKVNALTLSWTLVHPITENSPLFHLKKEDFQNLEGEIIVFLRVFDDMFSTQVVKRSSYTFDEIVYGAKFIPMFTKSEDSSRTVLHIDKLNSYTPEAIE